MTLFEFIALKDEEDKLRAEYEEDMERDEKNSFHNRRERLKAAVETFYPAFKDFGPLVFFDEHWRQEVKISQGFPSDFRRHLTV